jgi:hypothetical protein
MKDQELILAQYRRYRGIATQLAMQFVKALPKEAFNDSAQELGLLKRGTIVLENEQEMDILTDFCVHEHRVEGRNVVQRLLEEAPPPPGSDELLVHTAMAAAFYSIFRVESKVTGVGVNLRDLLREGSHFVADIQFGKSATVGLGLAMRLIPFSEFKMSSGAALPIVGPGASEIRRELDRSFDLATTEFADLSPEQQHRLTAVVVRSALAQGLSSRIRFAALDQPPGMQHMTEGSPPPRSSRSKIGRNDPCPCGSGVKYKKCCGIHES